MKRRTTTAALAATLMAGIAANAVPAQAAVNSGQIDNKIAALKLDGADDNVTVSVANGLLVHNQTTGGLASATDWDSAAMGNQTVPADGTFSVEINGGDGNDSITVLAKKTEIASAILNGDNGDDVLTGADSNDLLNGGDGNDRVVGGQGNDNMSGGTGNDDLVWNNGDATDTINGDAGNDATVVNGNATLGDVFTVTPNAGRIKFDRTNLVPFSLDIGTSETMHANGLAGNDTISVGDVGPYEVTAAGGAGNDTLTGGAGSESLLGGSGNDTITPGSGLDVVSGDDGDDVVNVRDTNADVARGGDGNDSVVADTADLDILDGFETIDRTQVVTPPPVDDSTRPVTIAGGTVTASRANRTVAISVSCPAASTVDCTGSLVLRTAAPVKAAGIKSVLQLGSVRYDVAPGASARLTVRLPSGIRRLADKKGRVKVLAVASTGAQGKIATTSQRLTLQLRAAAKKRH